MNSRNLVRLLLTTLLLGGLSAVLVGIAARWNELGPLITKGAYGELLMTIVWLIGLGFLFSVISQMGFFAYLTVHRFGLGIFGASWKGVQVVLIAFVLFDLIYFGPIWFGNESDRSIYAVYSAFLLVSGLAVGWYKARITNNAAFIPAVFFMIIVTVVEWVPVLRSNDKDWMLFMLLPLLICNAYQLLILGSLNTRSRQELELKKN
ncbi:KinB-signaling pathway activation protein [Peribacillus deserti]|uniref:KinB-signaling pathway activation protein n=1 Tax=Peribacillus deserti TaxID=673318 RepID=A0A2N5MAL2_9BACI|nr:KinB-signaling pathway activation protein [Peribacillus deserti]PLT31367.1 KinB-signaling pathway activation protein [Peribacillus deserti]